MQRDGASTTRSSDTGPETRPDSHTIPIVDGRYDLVRFSSRRLKAIAEEVMGRYNGLNESQAKILKNTVTSTLTRYEAGQLLQAIHDELEGRDSSPGVTDEPSRPSYAEQVQAELKARQGQGKDGRPVRIVREEKPIATPVPRQERSSSLPERLKARLTKEGLPDEMQTFLAKDTILVQLLEERIDQPEAFAAVISKWLTGLTDWLGREGLEFKSDGTLAGNIGIADPTIAARLQEFQILLELAIKLEINFDPQAAKIKEAGRAVPERKLDLAEQAFEHLKSIGVPIDTIATALNGPLLDLLKKMSYRQGDRAIFVRAVDQNILQTTLALQNNGVKRISSNGDIDVGFMLFGKDKKIAAIKGSNEYQQFQALHTIATDLRSGKATTVETSPPPRTEPAPVVPIRPVETPNKTTGNSTNRIAMATLAAGIASLLFVKGKEDIKSVKNIKPVTPDRATPQLAHAPVSPPETPLYGPRSTPLDETRQDRRPRAEPTPPVPTPEPAPARRSAEAEVPADARQTAAAPHRAAPRRRAHPQSWEDRTLLGVIKKVNQSPTALNPDAARSNRAYQNVFPPEVIPPPSDLPPINNVPLPGIDLEPTPKTTLPPIASSNKGGVAGFFKKLRFWEKA